MKRPDTTSARVARLAGLILGSSQFNGGFCCYSGKTWHVIRVEDILAMAGSLVNQAADHAERETLRRGKLPRGHRLVRRGAPVVRNHKARSK